MFFLKKITCIFIALVQGLNNFTFLITRFLPVMRGKFGAATVSNRLADLLYISLISAVLWFAMEKFTHPSQYFSQYTMMALIFGVTTFLFMFLLGRKLNLTERKKLVLNIYTPDDPRRMFRDGWAYDAPSALIITACGWFVSSTMLIYIAAKQFLDVTPTLVESAVFLLDNEATRPYIIQAGLSSTNWPSEAHYFSAAFQGILSILVVSSLLQLFVIWREVLEAWNELFHSAQPLTPVRKARLSGAIIGASHKWKKRIINKASDKNQTTYQRQTALDLAGQIKAVSIANLLPKLHEERNNPVKIKIVQTIYSIMNSNPTLFNKDMQKSLLKTVTFQLYSKKLARKIHIYPVRNELNKLKKLLEKQLLEKQSLKN